jgi:hypothetical protein
MLQATKRAEIKLNRFMSAIVIFFQEKLGRTRAKCNWFTTKIATMNIHSSSSSMSQKQNQTERLH